MRYRDARQAFFPCGRLLGHNVRDEGASVLGHGVDGDEQLPDGGHQGDLGKFAPRAEPLVVGPEPGILAHGGEGWHPEGRSQGGVPDGGEAGASGRVFAGLARGGDHAHVGGERPGIAELGGIAQLGDEAGGGLGADPVDGGQQGADLVVAQQALDVAREGAQAAAQQVEVFAGVADLDPVGLAMVAPDGDLGGLDELPGQGVPDRVAPVVAEAGEPGDRDALKRRRGGVVVQDGRGELAVEPPDVARELREAEVHEPVELAHAVAEVLDQALPQPDQLAQLFGGGVGQAPRRGALLRGEAPGPQGVQEGDGEAPGHERGEEVLPVVPGGLHGDERVGRFVEQAEEPGIAGGVLGEGRRLNHHRARLIDGGHDVGLRGDIDPHKAHGAPFRREASGASEPVFVLALVHARTPLAPRDTVRALNTGRGRHSHSRGRSLQRAAATLSRIPSPSIYTRSPR